MLSVQHSYTIFLMVYGGEKSPFNSDAQVLHQVVFSLKKYLKIEKNAVNVVVRLGSAGGSTDYDE